MQEYHEQTGTRTQRRPSQPQLAVNNEQIRALLLEYLTPIKTSFAYYRQCTWYLDTYNNQQTEKLLTLVANQAIRDRSQLCQLCAIGAISALFGREIIPAEVGDHLYDAARFLKRACSLDSPLEGMRVCVLLGLFNLWNKSLEAIEHFDFGIGLARKLQSDPRFSKLEHDSQTFRDIRKVWRSLRFGKSWLQATLGYLSNDDGLQIPNSTGTHPELDENPDKDELLAREIENITILNAQGFRMLLIVSRPGDCLSQMEEFSKLLGNWYSRLPPEAKVDRINVHNGFTATAIYYVHLQHLSAVMLTYRRAISLFASESARNDLTQEQREQLTKVLNEGILAAKQAARLLFLIVEEGRGLSHCWTIIYNAYVCGTILLHSVSQLQIHGYPESRWGPSMALVKNAMTVLDYCSRLDPVARGLWRILGNRIQTFDGINTAFTWDLQEDMRQTYRDDMIDLIFSERMGHTLLASVRAELQKLICRQFSGAPDETEQEEKLRQRVDVSWQSLLPLVFGAEEPARSMGWEEQRSLAQCVEGAAQLNLVAGANAPNNPLAM